MAIFTPIDTDKWIPAIFVGDIHGNIRDVEKAILHALRNGVKTVIQVGDFWAYSSRSERDKIDRIVRRLCHQFATSPDDFKFIFIDGNHEDFPYLSHETIIAGDMPRPLAADIKDNYEAGIADLPVHANRKTKSGVQISAHLFYFPRGSVLEVEAGGRVFKLGFLGGATSIDKTVRIPGKTWWAAEDITENDVKFALRFFGESIDILVSHDTTISAYKALPFNYSDVSPDFFPAVEESDKNRHLIEKVVEKSRPAIIVHGHFHDSLRASVPFTHQNAGSETIESYTDLVLDRESRPGSFAILPANREALARGEVILPFDRETVFE